MARNCIVPSEIIDFLSSDCLLSIMDTKLKALAVDLHDIGALKFGDFLTKNGGRTPVYFDLRVIVSYPELMTKVSDILYEFAVKESACEHVCGVPYTALPLATLVAVRARLPMLMRRKEAKAHGTRNMIEGHYRRGQSCLVIEDVVTTGSSVLETVDDLRKEGLVCTEAVVLVNREQGGEAALGARGVRMRALYTLQGLVTVLAAAGRIDGAARDAVTDYVRASHVPNGNAIDSEPPAVDRTKMPFEERAKLARNPVAKQLFTIMAEKQSNLCISVDLTTTSEILGLLEKVGQHACLVKTHADIIEDFTEEFVARLKALAAERRFLVLEDRKYADIGHTVALQCRGGVHRAARWADAVTAHALPGAGSLRALAADGGPRAVFLVAEMSCADNLISGAYTTATVEMARAHPALVAGLVCQNAGSLTEPGLVQLTPGVRLECAGDALGQVYATPASAVLERGADVAVVGRGVVAAASPQAEAERYRRALWDAYLERTHQ